MSRERLLPQEATSAREMGSCGHGFTAVGPGRHLVCLRHREKAEAGIEWGAEGQITRPLSLGEGLRCDVAVAGF